MIPFSPKLDLLALLNNKKNYWKTSNSEHQYLLSRSSWSLLTICLLRREKSQNKKVNLFLPEYFCNDPIPILDRSIINISYYEVDEHFKPIINSLNKIADNSKPDIFLCVHYFGQPIYSNDLTNFCSKHKSWYVEDATHCLKKDSIIGNQGDFVLFSLYKHLPLPDGAILIVREKGPSKLNLQSYKKMNINYFLKKELIGLNFNKGLIKKNSNIRSLIWILKKVARLLIQNTKFSNNYYKKIYEQSLNLIYSPQSYSYNISVFSKFLFDRFDLGDISKLKLRNQLIFKSILKNYINIHPNFELILSYNFHTPYIIPIVLKKNQTPLELIKKGIPLINWPLYPESIFKLNKNIKNKFDKYYFLIIHNSIKLKDFQKLMGLGFKSEKIEFITNKINPDDWNQIALKSSNYNILQSWNYGLSKSIIEKKKIERYKILINQKPVGFFQVLSKTYFQIIEIKRINRGPIFVKSLSLQNKTEVLMRIMKMGNIFRGKILSFSPEISFFSVESIFFNSSRLFKLPYQNWKSSVILLENDLDIILLALKPKWRNALKYSNNKKIVVRIYSTRETITTVLNKYNEFTKKKNFKGINSDLITKISFLQNRYEQLYTVEASSNGEIIGLIVVSVQSKNSIYLIGWSNDLGRKYNINNRLLWEAIIYLKEKKCSTFDLGGLIGDSHPIDKFKIGLNGSYYENIGEFLKI